MSEVIVEPLRLGRGKRKKKRYRIRISEMKSPHAKGFMELEGQFRTLGRIIGREETFRAKLSSAICYGLAEVCEMLAQIAEEEFRFDKDRV